MSSIATLRNPLDPSALYIQFTNAQLTHPTTDSTCRVIIDSAWKTNALVSIFLANIPEYNPRKDTGWVNNSYIIYVPLDLLNIVFITYPVKSFRVRFNCIDNQPKLTLISVQEYHSSGTKWNPTSKYNIKMLALVPSFCPTPLSPILE